MMFRLFVLIAAAQAQNWFDGECGVSKYDDAGRLPLRKRTFNGVDPHIVNGWDSRPGEFPWQLELQYFGSLTCGAVLINEQWALTAAHCVEGRTASSLAVIAGQNVRGENGTQMMAIESVEYHADYDITGEIENDIAIMKFTKEVILSEDVVPVCKPAGSYEDGSGITTGWGRLSNGGVLATILQVADNPIMEQDACTHCFADGWILPGMLCFGVCDQNVRSTCNGDSGGPMVVPDTDNDFEVVGLTSWGLGGCLSTYPPVFTNVSYFTEWVDDRVNQTKLN